LIASALYFFVKARNTYFGASDMRRFARCLNAATTGAKSSDAPLDRTARE
jgi:hypothetical protein